MPNKVKVCNEIFSDIFGNHHVQCETDAVEDVALKRAIERKVPKNPLAGFTKPEYQDWKKRLLQPM